MAATFDGTEEPLFADDLDEYSDEEDPPPLPPPIVSGRPSHATTHHTAAPPVLSQRNESTQSRGSTHGQQESTTAPGEQEQSDTTQQKKKVRKPLLTLKVDRLFGENGLPYLTREFPKLKFKGKGHEAADLKYLLKQYEHWANRVYPKYTFNDFIKRVETLGSKSKEFKTQFRNMRYRSAGLAVPGEGGGEEGEEGQEEEETEEQQLMEEDENTDPTLETDLTHLPLSVTGTDPSDEQLNTDSGTRPTANNSVDSPHPDLWDVIDPSQDENPYDDIDDLLND